MTTGQTTPEHRHDPDIAALLDLLCTMYPKTFSRYEARRKPLKVGIDHDLVVTLDGAVTTAELDRALGCYTANRVYRSRLREGAVRIGLDGEAAGTVSAAHATGEHLRRRAVTASSPLRTSPAGLRHWGK